MRSVYGAPGHRYNEGKAADTPDMDAPTMIERTFHQMKARTEMDPYGASKPMSVCVPSQKGLFFE
jgi:hypothetical protein